MQTDAIAHALLAVTAMHAGDPDGARTHLAAAQHHRQAVARRERQVVEIAALVVTGCLGRAADLAVVHRAEFPDDVRLLEIVVG